MLILRCGLGLDLTDRSMARFKRAEELKLIAHLRSRVHELKGRGESRGRFVTALGRKMRCFSQADRRQKQECEPRPASDIARLCWNQPPTNSRDHQDNDSGGAPAAKNSARSP